MSKDFRLYLVRLSIPCPIPHMIGLSTLLHLQHTKLSNPHYPPEIQAETTLVNFSVTQDGLDEQLLALVVKFERPDLAAQRSALILQVRKEMKALCIHRSALIIHGIAKPLHHQSETPRRPDPPSIS